VCKLIIPLHVESLSFHFMLKAHHSTSCGKLIIQLYVERSSSTSRGINIKPPCVENKTLSHSKIYLSLHKHQKLNDLIIKTKCQI